MRWLPAAILASLFICGCAPTARHAVAPSTGVATSQPSGPPEAFLPLEQIPLRPVLANIKPASQPTSRPSLDALELYARARGAMLDNQRTNAINLLQRAIEADPYSFEPRYLLGRVYASLDTKSDQAIKTLESAAAINPDHLELQVELGREFLARQDPANAILHLRLALQTHDYGADDELASLADFY